MTRRNWKRIRPTSAIEALRLCKDFAQAEKNLSIERIADLFKMPIEQIFLR